MREITPELCVPGRTGRLVVLAAVLAAAALLALGVAATAAADAGVAPTSAGAADAVLVAPSDFSSADELIALVSARGACAALVLLPRTVLAQVSPSAAAGLRADGFAVLRAADSPRSAPSLQARQALVLLRQLESLDRFATTAPMVADVPTLGDDLLHPSQPTSAESFADPLRALLGRATERGLPRATEPAAFAAGSVAVSIIFPESDGGVDTETEDWSNDDPFNPGDRRSALTAQILTALSW